MRLVMIPRRWSGGSGRRLRSELSQNETPRHKYRGFKVAPRLNGESAAVLAWLDVIR